MNDVNFITFFNAKEKITSTVHVIGCGAIGSHICEYLARINTPKIEIWDDDTVESKNIANQCYVSTDIGKKKTEVCANRIKDINPECVVTLHDQRWNNQRLEGYIFMCVDNIDTRKEIVQNCIGNAQVKAIFDFRMELTQAQHYAARTNNLTEIKKLMDTMDFTHEEAKQNTAVNPCGSTLSIIPTVTTVTSLGVSNFINLLTNKENFVTGLIASPFLTDIMPLK